MKQESWTVLSRVDESPLLLKATLISLFVLFAAVLTAAPALATDDDSDVSRLVDDAGVLSDDEQALIEDRIQDVEEAGAPTVVYLRLFEVDDDRSVIDAQQVMQAENVESHPGARDGVVFFFNLNPDDPNRGEFAIVAGEHHYDDGALPRSELNRIRNQMTDLLADDRLADGIALGLELTAERLEAGPREPTAFESFLERIASGPFSLVNGVSLALAGLLGMIGWRTWRDRPRTPHLHPVTTSEPPGDLHPSLAGALVRGNVDHAQVEAAILVLGERGALAFEPDDNDQQKIQIRILDPELARTPYEKRMMDLLEEGAKDGVIDQDTVASTRWRWNQIRETVRADLEARGWFDPQFGARRLPLILVGIIAILLGVAAVIPVPFIEDPWSLVGAAALGLVGIVSLSLAATYPHTTFEGERQAVPWRGYRDGLQQAAREEYGQIDLDEAFPYIVALSLANDFSKHLEKASEAGYVPAWLLRTDEAEPLANNWFVYWVTFHGAVSPQSQGSAGSVPGGAATGSGGVSGRF